MSDVVMPDARVVPPLSFGHFPRERGNPYGGGT